VCCCGKRCEWIAAANCGFDLSANVKVRVTRTTTADVEVDVPESEIAKAIREAIVEGVKRCDQSRENNAGDLAGRNSGGCRWWRVVLVALRAATRR
jgi:hypothetical protein